MEEHRPGEGGAANTPPFPRTEVPSAAQSGEDLGGASGKSDRARNVAEDVAEESLASARESLDRAAQEKNRLLDGAARAAEGAAREARNLAADAGERIRRRAQSRVNRGFESVADRLDDTAERIDRLADDRLAGGGARGKAGDVAHSTAHAIEDVAEYFRETDLGTMQADLERRVRERPIQTLLLAAGAGWVLGKIMK